jgi:hypothetical protein
MMRTGFLAVICFASAPVLAQPAVDQPPPPTPTTDPSLGPAASSSTETSTTGEAPPPEKKKEPGRGDFDAGGQVRFPNGPDENSEYKSFNWIALDLKGRYYLLDQVTVDGFFPLAVKKPEAAGMGGPEPSMIGGLQTRLEAKFKAPKMPMVPSEGTQVGLQLSLGYMREGAMLLSEKDFPLYVGDFKPGIGTGLLMKVKLSSLLDFSLVPAWVYQSGTMESLTAVQIPMSLRVALGELLKLSFDLGVYTGDDYSFSGDEGGRIATGAALTVKLGPIVLHTGAGVASLLTGGLYPSVSDSVYVDVNVKYAK